MVQKLIFSGHESFFCKEFWLKKGYDHIIAGKTFYTSEAVMELGVGRNMVTAINYWGKAFGIFDDNLETSKIGDYLFGKTGKDIYLENIGSLWLLHYKLVSHAKASIYYLVFNEFSRERFEFTKGQLHNFLKRKCFEKSSNTYNERTIKTDISVFLRNYLKPKKTLSKIKIEDDFTALLIDLELIKQKRLEDSEKQTYDLYSLESKERGDLPCQIVLYSILDNYENNSISFNELMIGNNSPGKVFCLSREGLYAKIEEITSKNKKITFSQTAGNEILQINFEMNKWEVLNEYYN